MRSSVFSGSAAEVSAAGPMILPVWLARGVVTALAAGRTGLRLLPWALVPVLLSTPPPIMIPALHGVDLISVWPGIVLSLLVVAALTHEMAAWLPGAAVLTGWAVVRAAMGGWPPESAQTLMWLLFGVVLYLAAVRVPLEGQGRRIERAFFVGLGAAILLNAVIGLVNLAGSYPLLSMLPEGFPRRLHIEPHAVGLPTGQLPHPNHWSLLMAFGLPLLWVATRRLGWVLRGGLAVAWLALIATGRSRIALAVAVVGVLALVWRWPGRRGWPVALTTTIAAATWLVAALSILQVLRIGALSMNLTGGRLDVFGYAFPTVWTWKWIGTGLGMWERWALSPDGLAGYHGEFAGWFSTAHSEPFQAWFELGVLGVLAGAWAVGTVGRDAISVWRTDDAFGHALVAIALMAVLAMWVTIPFRIPVLAVTVLVAAARVQVRARAHRARQQWAPPLEARAR